MTEAEVADLLDDISVCFIDRDFEKWENRLLLPFTIVTQAGPVTMTTQDSVRDNFDLYLSACKVMSLDTIFRRPLSVENCQDGTFILTYRTELLSKGTRQTEPFTSSALVTQSGGTWRIMSILNARGHHGWTGHHPHKSGDQK